MRCCRPVGDLQSLLSRIAQWYVSARKGPSHGFALKQFGGLVRPHALAAGKPPECWDDSARGVRATSSSRRNLSGSELTDAGSTLISTTDFALPENPSGSKSHESVGRSFLQRL